MGTLLKGILDDEYVVLIPSLNSSKTILECLDSVFTMDDFKGSVLVIDNGSEDDTLKILKNYRQKNLYYFTEKKRGIQNALNSGLKRIKCNFLIRMDADDICCRDRFKFQKNFFINNPEYGVCGGFATAIDYNNKNLFSMEKPIADSQLKKHILNDSPFIHPTVMFNMSVLGKFYYPNIINGQDYILWIILSKNDILFKNISEYLIKYRISDTGSSNRSYFQRKALRKIIDVTLNSTFPVNLAIKYNIKYVKRTKISKFFWRNLFLLNKTIKRWLSYYY